MEGGAVLGGLCPDCRAAICAFSSCICFLRGVLELLKLILQVLDSRGLCKSRASTDEEHQHALTNCYYNHDDFPTRVMMRMV